MIPKGICGQYYDGVYVGGTSMISSSNGADIRMPLSRW